MLLFLREEVKLVYYGLTGLSNAFGGSTKLLGLAKQYPIERLRLDLNQQLLEVEPPKDPPSSRRVFADCELSGNFGLS